MNLTSCQKDAVVRAILLDTPKPDRSKRHAAVQAGLCKAMSPECRKVFKRTPGILESRYCEYTFDGVRYSTRFVVVGDAAKDTLEKLVQPYKDADAAYSKAEASLTNAIKGCRTLAQLKKIFPEFEKYLPTEQQPTKNLPALANVVADLAKLGWPKKGGAA